MKTTSPLFIVGVPRSGTTVLANRLRRHPDIHIGEKTISPNFFDFREEAQRTYGLNGDVGKFKSPDWALHFVRHQPDLAPLLSDVINEEHVGLRDLLGRAVADAASKDGAKLWGDKVPDGALHMKELLFLFPEAKFIHIIRDGRAVSVSQRDRQDEHLKYAMHNWKRMILLGRLDGAIVGPDQYLELRYEDLLFDPEKELRTIVDFLELEFDPSMVAESAGPQTSEEDLEPGVVGRYVLPGFDVAKVNAWKEKLTSDQIKTLERIGGDLLANLGYDLIEYSPDGPFQALSPWSVAMKRQRKQFKRLLRRQTTMKSGEDLVEVSKPLSKRVVDFTRRSCNNFLNVRITRQFAKEKTMVD